MYYGISRNNYWKQKLIIPDTQKSIYLDIETDLHSTKIWLIGVLYQDIHEQFIANNWDEEESILLQFSEYLEKRPFFPVLFYSATHFDYRVIFAAAQRLKLTVLLENMKQRAWIDLTILIKKSYSPNHSLALKKFGTRLGYPLTYEKYSGLRLAREYIYQVSKDNSISSELKKIALAYNLDDIKLLPFIIMKLSNLYPGQVSHTKQYHYSKSPQKIFAEVTYVKIKEHKQISIGCSNDLVDDLYYQLICLGTILPTIYRGVNSSRLVWRGKTGYNSMKLILNDHKMLFRNKES